MQAGEDALGECDRDQCSVWFQDYYNNAPLCTAACFTASCDWSRSLCAAQRASIATCPVFDAAVLQSIRSTQLREELLYIEGGTARSHCAPTHPSTHTSTTAHTPDAMARMHRRMSSCPRRNLCAHPKTTHSAGASVAAKRRSVRAMARADRPRATPVPPSH